MNTLQKIIVIIVPILIIGVWYGYIANIIKITKLDGQAPYKAEILRIAGVLFPPLGIIEGYLDIED